MMKHLLLSMLLATTAAAPVPSGTLRFSNAPLGSALPAGWSPYTMSRKHPMADIAIVDTGATHSLRIDADHDAGAVAYKLNLSPRTVLTWRWKVDHSVAAADMGHRKGDDFAARLYVFFDVPASQLSLGDRLKLHLARMVLGHPLPRAAICYVWDNRHPVGTIAPGAFYRGVRTIVLQSGNARAGRWQVQRRDLAADYRAAFGKPAPRITGIALAADTDNTGSRAQAWFGDLAFSRERPANATDSAAP